MNSIIIPCSPKECEQIANGDMTVLIRKVAPKEVPFKAYIYCTSSNRHFALVQGGGRVQLVYACNYKTAIVIGGEISNGNVIGEFICDKVEECIPDYNPITQEFFYNEWEDSEATCLTSEEQSKYGKSKPLYGLHLTEVKIYDEPRELSEFKICKVIRGYHKNDEKNETFKDKLQSLKHSKRIEVKRLNKAPATYCYVEED